MRTENRERRKRFLILSKVAQMLRDQPDETVRLVVPAILADRSDETYRSVVFALLSDRPSAVPEIKSTFTSEDPAA